MPNKAQVAQYKPRRNPIVEEDRKNGKRIFEEAGGTLESYFEYMKKVCENSGHPLWQGKGAPAEK